MKRWVMELIRENKWWKFGEGKVWEMKTSNTS